MRMKMKPSLALVRLVVALVCGSAQFWSTAAQELVHFPSLEDNGAGQPATTLDGYLYRPAGAGPFPAIVGLHGCSGMFIRGTGTVSPIYRQWGAELARHGFVFLLVDSFKVRGHGETCSVGGFDLNLFRRRPRDAYGALRHLQGQPFVRPDRIGLAGWSQGGGATLFAIGRQSPLRPSNPPPVEFRAAAVFYPGACNERRQGAAWNSAVPLLVLMGAEDVWTPVEPCRAFLGGAIARGNAIEVVVYPGAHHGFDVPDNPRRELPAYRTRAGVVPIVGTDPAGRADALQRVPAFFARQLGD
jgi:dienelactone hydrolase